MKKEATAHGVWEDLANRNDNWDKLDGVPEKVTELDESRLILKNEVKNGNFINLDNWNTNSGSTTVQNNIARITASSAYSRIRQTLLGNVVVGKKYYIRARVKALTSVPSIRIQLGTIGNYTHIVKAINSPTLDIWHMLDGIITITDQVSLTLQVGVEGGASAIYEIQEVIAIDLTTTFGEGNEPTKEEMDIIMDTIGWFNGTHTITSKEQFNILLKMVRENALATTSLGGGF